MRIYCHAFGELGLRLGLELGADANLYCHALGGLKLGLGLFLVLESKKALNVNAFLLLPFFVFFLFSCYFSLSSLLYFPNFVSRTFQSDYPTVVA